MKARGGIFTVAAILILVAAIPTAQAALGVGFTGTGPHEATVNGTDLHPYTFDLEVTAEEGEDHVDLTLSYEDASDDAIAPASEVAIRPDGDVAWSDLGDLTGFGSSLLQTDLPEGRYELRVVVDVPNEGGDHRTWLRLEVASPNGGSTDSVLYDHLFHIEEQGLDVLTPEPPVVADASTSFEVSPTGGKPVEQVAVELDGTPHPMDLQDGTHGITVSTCGATSYRYIVTYTDGRTLAVPEDGSTLAIEPPEAPTAGFTFSPQDPETGESVTFTDDSTAPASCPIVDRTWDLGDGASATGSTVSHAYDEAGTYQVTLTVTQGGGATDSVTRTLDVAEPPPSDGEATTEEGSGDDDTTTSDGSSTSSGTGDPSTSPSPPSVSFTVEPTDPTAGTTVLFEDGSTPSGDTSLTGWSWSFGDGATSTGPNVTHVYDAAGTYSVTLEVTQSDGQTATSSRDLTILEASQGSGPGAPTDLATDPPLEDGEVTIPPTGLVLSWSPPEGGGAATYQVTVDGFDARTVAGTNVTLHDLRTGTHVLGVRAVGGDGTLGPSAEITVTVVAPSGDEDGAQEDLADVIARQLEVLEPGLEGIDVELVDEDGDGVPDGIVTSRDALLEVRHGREQGKVLVRANASGNLYVIDMTSGEVAHAEEVAAVIVAEEGGNVTIVVPSKTGWIYLHADDRRPSLPLLNVTRSDGVVIPLDLVWREDGLVYILDDPATEYTLVYGSSGSGETASGPFASLPVAWLVTAVVLVGIVLLLVVAWRRRG